MLRNEHEMKERWTVGNIYAVHDQRSETFAKSRLRSRFKIERTSANCNHRYQTGNFYQCKYLENFLSNENLFRPT